MSKLNFIKISISFCLMVVVSLFSISNAFAAPANVESKIADSRSEISSNILWYNFATGSSKDTYFHLKLNGDLYTSMTFNINNYQDLAGLQVSLYDANEADENATLIQTKVLDGTSPTVTLDGFEVGKVYNIKMTKAVVTGKGITGKYSFIYR
ncbi:hypothetical protein [Marininema halotolerans]|uniref:Uncharacterized protein n=1 Tax=Marininema halotolerans TaxID=1155944 RepID=A0A1I6S1B9_9BACL|nr:hypothetical protein [Marininema halotolerans]SFS70775.1 hypothetical protein SAMN05444972_10683 [Marininema halotolerans]